MVPRPTFTQARARLVPDGGAPSGARCYRPLVAGLAVLRRVPRAASWSIAIACDRLLVPQAPRRVDDAERLLRSLARRGITCRVGGVLVGPIDLPPGWRSGPLRVAVPRGRPRPLVDIYGWALMYQPPGMRGRAVVDADGRFPDLPAVFELPLELLDRAAFLEARGFRTRPLVIPTRPEDFAPGPDGRPRNRFFPNAACRHPSRLDGLI